jgi:hypothetical protein
MGSSPTVWKDIAMTGNESQVRDNRLWQNELEFMNEISYGDRHGFSADGKQIAHRRLRLVLALDGSRHRRRALKGGAIA